MGSDHDRAFDRHALTVTGGYAWPAAARLPFLYAGDLSSDQLGPDGIPTAGLYRNTLFVEESKLASWFGRVNCTFRTSTWLRLPSSGRLLQVRAGNQWGTFPAVCGGSRRKASCSEVGWVTCSQT
jgi:hypothetical protein